MFCRHPIFSVHRLLPGGIGWMCALLLTCFCPLSTEARVRLESICTLEGQQEVKLTGMGLVVGLAKTGDGVKSASTVRALRAAMSRMHQPTGDLDIRNADNIAVVMIEATIPRSGLRRGQKIDCFISAPLGATSLQGGRLLATPLTTIDARDDSAVAIASGAVTLEDPKIKTTGKISVGVDLLADVTALFVKRIRGDSVTLLIDKSHASFFTAREVARVVNTEFSFEAGGKQLAMATSPHSVEIKVPEQYRETPVDFVAEILEVGIDIPNTSPRVILNEKSGTVVVTGEVEISPVVITHRNFTVQVEPLPDTGAGGGRGPFVAFKEGAIRQSPQQLDELVRALHLLRVPTQDVIAIIRELHASGKLHAELINSH